jgi:hypothetical protein
MSNPNPPTDWGINSRKAQEEWEEFLRKREESFQQVMDLLATSHGVAASMDLPEGQQATVADALFMSESAKQEAERNRRRSVRPDGSPAPLNFLQKPREAMPSRPENQEYLERSLPDEIVKGLWRSTAQLSMGLGQTLQATAAGIATNMPLVAVRNAPLLDMLIDLGRRIEVQSATDLQSDAMRPSTWVETEIYRPLSGRWWAARGSEVIGQIATQVGLAVATQGQSRFVQLAAWGTPVVALEGGATFREGMDWAEAQGLSLEDQLHFASGVALINGAVASQIERIPFHAVFAKTPAFRRIVNNAVAAKAAAYLASGGAEMGTEVLQEFASDAILWAGSGGDTTFFDEWQQRYAAAGTLGFGAGVAARGFRDAADRLGRPAIENMGVYPGEPGPIVDVDSPPFLPDSPRRLSAPPLALPPGPQGPSDGPSGGPPLTGPVQTEDQAARAEIAETFKEITDKAEELAVNLSNRNIMLESSIGDQVALDHLPYDHTDVAMAAVERAPGQVSIISGITDPDDTKLIKQLVHKSQGRLMPHQIRLVPRRADPEQVAATAVRWQGQIWEGRPGMRHSDVLNLYDLWPTPTERVEPGVLTTHGEYISVEEGRILHDDRGMIQPPDDQGMESWPEPVTHYDLLVSDGMPITNKMVAQYKRWGFFEGQVARHRDMPVRIRTIGYRTMVEPLSDPYMKPYEVNLGTLRHMSALYGEQDIGSLDEAAYEMYADLHEYVAEMLGLHTERDDPYNWNNAWLSPEVTSNLPRLIDSFLNMHGIAHPVTRAAAKYTFHVLRTNEYRATVDPVEWAEKVRLEAERAKMLFADPYLTFEEEVSVAGFALDLNPEGGFDLIDLSNDSRIPMPTEEAILAFVRNVQRGAVEIMDLDAPADLLGPHAADHMSNVEPRLTNDAEIEGIGEGAKRIAEELGVDTSKLNYDDFFDEELVKAGSARIGLDRSMITKQARLYSGQLGHTMTRELNQNNADASRGSGSPIMVIVDTYDNTVETYDRGTGMSHYTLTHAYLDLGGSDKPDGSTGGFGFAKAALFVNSTFFRTETVWQDPATGLKHRSWIEATEEQRLADDMPTGTEIVPDDTPTGTHQFFQVDPDNPIWYGGTKESLENQIKYNVTNVEIRALLNEQAVIPSGDGIVWEPDMALEHQVSGAKVRLTPSQETDKTDRVNLVIRNNGLWQYNKIQYISDSKVPTSFIVDVEPTVGTEHADYPFTGSREELKGPARDYIESVLEKFSALSKKEEIHSIVDALKTPAKVPDSKYGVYPASKSISDQLAAEIASHPGAKVLMEALEETLNEVKEEASRGLNYHPSRLTQSVFGGFGLSSRYRGVNIQAALLRSERDRIARDVIKAGGKESDVASIDDLPDSNMILYNPFAVFGELPSWLVDKLADGIATSDEIAIAANKLAQRAFATMSHEHGHDMARGHNEEFSSALTDILSVTIDIGAEQKAKLAKAWTTALKSGFGRLTPKVYEAWELGEVDDIFKKISGHESVRGHDSVHGGSDIEAGSFMDEESSSFDGSASRPGEGSGDTQGSQPPFLGVGAYMGGAGTTGDSGGGWSGTPVPPFLTGHNPAGLLGPGMDEIASMFKRRGPMAAQALNELVVSFGFRWFQPTYHAMKNLDTALQKVLGMRVSLADMYTAVSTGYTKMRNDAAPWMHEAEDIIIKVRRKFERDGTFVRVMEIGDVNQTIEEMTRLGFTAKERQAVWDMREFLDRFFNYMVADPAYKIGDWRYVFGYVSRVRARQLADMGNASWDDDALPQHLKFFAEEARRGNIDFREMHMGNIMGRMIRGAMFHKHVRPSWETMVQTWDRPEVPENVRAYIVGFLNFVQRGRDPREDMVLVGVRQMLNKMGVPITDQDMAAFSGGIVGNAYRAYLGLRPDVLLRENMQWGMAGSKTGFKPQIEYGWKPALRGGKTWEGMIKFAIEKGWVEPGIPRGIYAGAFEESTLLTGSSHPFYSVDDTPQMVQRQQDMAERRETWSSLIDHIVNRLPGRFRKGIADTGLDPLYWYGKTTSAGKVIVGNASYKHAMVEIERYRRGEINLDQLHKVLGTVYYGLPLQQAFEEALHAGNLDAAASRYANDVVADAMLKTGGHEQPLEFRKRGMFGRLGLMFGTFAAGALAWLKSGAKGVGGIMAAKFLTRYASLIAAAAAAEAATGMKFSKWLYHDAFMWAGGPAVKTGLNVVQSYQGMTNIAQDKMPSTGQSEAMRNISTSGSDVARFLNPYSGGMRTVQQFGMAAQGPNPFYYALRFGMTGEPPASALQSDIKGVMQQQGQWMNDNMYRPGSSPPRNNPPFLQSPPPQDGPEQTGTSQPPFLPGGGAIQ